MNETFELFSSQGSRWKQRFLKPLVGQRTAMIGLAITLAYVLAALLAPWLATHDPTAQDLAATLQGPSGAHWLGTDSYGQDLYSRLLYGAQLALIIGFASVAIGLIAGVAIGLAAGLMGGRTEWVLMRIVDGLLAFPELILAMAFMAVLGLGTENVVYALALSFVGPFARMTRGDVLQVKNQPYIEAARLMGVPTVAIIWRHVLPNVVSPILVQAGMRISIAILLESGLSFLGIGVVPPTPDWGLMIAEGRAFITMAPWVSGVPGVALAILLVALNLLGDGLRDAFDPNTQKDS
ncbi:glutathione ABC transporter permease GsiD [Sulfurimicrobium lacus]|uniref:Glutathione ABC transporter permease GsiD n=1 Tax=Sulfurimicrobium lacus TaxID=2715678 RepID=A0A6F8VE34_9PROT|nr:ABC transporter permease [Sulfurimicrobium lacus]BCB28083.1 glutathione ABC transporter permease GsiD [Sulfurimicrobium lacus]